MTIHRVELTLMKPELIEILRKSKTFADIPDGADIYAVAPGGRPPHLELKISWPEPEKTDDEEES